MDMHVKHFSCNQKTIASNSCYNDTLEQANAICHVEKARKILGQCIEALGGDEAKVHEPFIANCVYDVCNGADSRAAFCSAIENYVQYCLYSMEFQNFEWREALGCGM